ncbi:MAG: M20/M25/M40 family metallo-hydrolase [Candidatus Aminicenantes bacterium]|nr:M20/M25/M40 family metallo-hydrolase [Candidatus Aminicenantes bacterium]
MLKTIRPLITYGFIFFMASALAANASPVQMAKTAAPAPASHKLALDIFKELVEIRTTLDIGSTKASEAMAQRLRAAVFPESDIQVLGPRPNNKNLVVRYRGRGKLRPILFIGHLDVVQARREDWSFDPFTFLEKDGYFYGRGTTDMKNKDADLVANFIRLKQEGLIPNRDLILALTDGEEGGDANGIQWLLANHRDLIEAEFCLNPDGGGGDIKNGKPVVMEVQTSEKIYFSYQLEVKNKGGHSSLPVPENAIYRLAAGLTRLAKFEFPIKLNETTRMYFERRAIRETGQTKADMLAILKTPIDTAAAGRLAAESAYYNAMMRTTCVATMLSAGHAENALPQSARAIVNCRMLPDDTPENVLATLKRVLSDGEIIITRIDEPFLSPLSPLRKDLMDVLDGLAAAMWPGVIVTPTMSTGATDGRMLRRAGIPVYGVSGMFGDMDDVRAHGKDERQGVKEFYDGVDFTYRLIKALSQ